MEANLHRNSKKSSRRSRDGVHLHLKSNDLSDMQTNDVQDARRKLSSLAHILHPLASVRSPTRYLLE